jgi:hypothetical protein
MEEAESINEFGICLLHVLAAIKEFRFLDRIGEI